MNSEIEKLLTVQAKDIAHSIEKDKLSKLPALFDAIDGRIAEVKKRFASAETALKELEMRRSDMRLKRRAIEEKSVKYKIQLPDVKKNEDYIALNREIEKLKEEASKMEEEELEVLFEIDSQTAAIPSIKAACDAEIAELNKEREAIVARGDALEAACSKAKQELDEESSKVSARGFEIYKKIRLSGKKLPIVVEVKTDSLCCGCHLKVSSETLSELKKSVFPTYCEQCGRILWANG